MNAVGYAAQTVNPDGTITLILADGRAVSVSGAAASALNATRECNGSPTIPTVALSDAQVLRDELTNRNAGHEALKPGDDCRL